MLTGAYFSCQCLIPSLSHMQRPSSPAATARVIFSAAQVRRWLPRPPFRCIFGVMSHPLQQTPKAEISSWFWLWLPLAAVVGELVFHMADAKLYRRVRQTELGPVENGTVLFVAIAIVFALLCLSRHRDLPFGWLRGWLLVALLGCIYFGGEEASWGQHWFGWATPDAMGALNDQQETNIHNISSWFDQKPRLLLELGVLVGGLLYPAWLRLRKRSRSDNPNDPWFWLWPTRVVIPTAALAILIVIPQRLDGAFGWPVPYPLAIRASETQEMLFGIFLMLYLWSFYRRLKILAR